MVREACRESWDRFISNTGNNEHERQQMVYKIMKTLNKPTKDSFQTNDIIEQEWIGNK